jgi:hypothetical protein
MLLPQIGEADRLQRRLSRVLALGVEVVVLRAAGASSASLCPLKPPVLHMLLVIALKLVWGFLLLNTFREDLLDHINELLIDLLLILSQTLLIVVNWEGRRFRIRDLRARRYVICRT